MSFKAEFFVISKKINSTKQPSTGIEYDCVIKTESGFLRPTIILALAATWSPTFNYCYIPNFRRYYWIEEWTFEDRCWTAALKFDAMASWKTNIGNASLYVLRSASSGDGTIIDTHYPMTATETKDVKNAVGTWFQNFYQMSSGTFVVGLRGRINSSQTAGGVTYLAMTLAQFKAFTDDLFSGSLNNYIQGGSLDISDTLAQMIFNPTQYIASCMWLPGSPSSEATASGFNVGWWAFTSGAKIMTNSSTLHYTETFTLTAHPQAGARGIYLNGYPFTSRQLQLPRYGIVDITNNVPANAQSITVTLEVDPISGQGIYKLYYLLTGDNQNIMFDQIQCQIGVDMPLSSNQITFQDFAGSLASVAGSVVNASIGNGIGAAADIASSLSVFQPHINDISAASGFLGYAGFNGFPILISRFKNVVASDTTEEGRPLCLPVQISTLSGYIQCLHGDLAISGAMIPELEEIKTYLENGFYYE